MDVELDDRDLIFILFRCTQKLNLPPCELEQN